MAEGKGWIGVRPVTSGQRAAVGILLAASAKKTSPIVCLFAALSVMWFVAFCQWFLYLLLFVFHCLTGSNVSNPIAFACSHWTPGFSSPECKSVWFLSGSQAVTHHDWTKEKSALSPLLNMNNKSVHPWSPLSPSNESCWLRPLLSLFPILFLFLLSFQVNQGPILHVVFFYYWICAQLKLRVASAWSTGAFRKPTKTKFGSTLRSLLHRWVVHDRSSYQTSTHPLQCYLSSLWLC